MGEIYIEVFLTSAIVGGQLLASSSGRFIPGEGDHNTHWIGGWVDPRGGLDDVERRKFFTLSDIEHRPLGHQTVASRYTKCAIYVLCA
jgi:hypothetical protein